MDIPGAAGTRSREAIATPEEAVDRLAELFNAATGALRASVERFLDTGAPPTPEERLTFRYPELTLTYRPEGVPATSPRAFAKFAEAGIYTTTVTHPTAFRSYLLEQLRPLVGEFGATIEVGVGPQEIPYPYVFERGDELGRGSATAAELARFFPTPLLSSVGDEIADGVFEFVPGEPRPLALFDAVRVDYSLRRLVHYTGTDWRHVQPWILLTNYHRYVDQFVQWGVEQLRGEGAYERLELPGGVRLTRDMDDAEIEARIAAAPWHRFQMPAYHAVAPGGRGVTLVNIGVGPSNAKNITDHLAVLRPHAWLMVGHCGGLRQSQHIGHYVLAHGYLRQDRILDALVPTDVPIPALAEVQVALQEAAARITGDRGEALKRRLRTGTVVTYDDRNWELRWSQERRRINLSRAIAVDMESGTVAAQGFRLRVPYGTLLCVSDKPLHGEIKLPGAANAFYERAVSEHLRIGLAALDQLRSQREGLHSRKLRSFDEPPFR
ncbi:AMP nucleosidase [Alsobacter sp. SYSU M60028]|uniref:AMP nucleosidase n=1 Tax=Alsobacter ponti TaxID=2962936 RepID=A0ABT1L895_9HYPH|nr:AMP nucleosidase [Alsobacter ponti]